MSYLRKYWKARVGTNLNKFTKSSETLTSVILTNAPDSITEQGTPFTDSNMNNFENGIIEAKEKGIDTIFNNQIDLMQSLQLTAGLNYFKGCVAPNGDVYITVYNGDIYKQFRGIGEFLPLGQTSRLYVGICSDLTGNIYVCVENGDIYKQTAGIGDFTALSQTSRAWRDVCKDNDGNIYACVYGGDIYKQTAGVGNFVALSQTSRNWSGIYCAPDGNIYACVYGGDMYKQTAGEGSFVTMSQTNRNYTAITSNKKK